MTATTEPAPASRAGKGGPRTPEGKARSAMNAMRHGLRARHFVLLPDESREEFDALVADLAADLQPVGRAEVELVGKIAICLWKEMRGDRMEGEMLPWLGGGRGPGTLGYAMGRSGLSEHEMNRVIRYQGYAGAQLSRTLAALHARQDRRRTLAEAGLVPEADEPACAPAAGPAPVAVEAEPESERTRAAAEPAAEVPPAEASPTDPAEAVAAELDALITGGVLPARGVEALIALAERSGVLPAVDAAPEPARANGRRPSATRPHAA